ncbi:cation diffusion facilitator family transporter [Demequina sp. TTPB684]|uniref:cation diffusion facilitator family transporter n=1 Tax=unclassified Demequina TaxID=2620311 RepID=UPI001CF4B96C|nr:MULTISPECIES: cation diffusion facilitator family transporter [unclassified Demequina]MCB2412310.1 cation diffusion facilitator family transporter [Demequina sp. TTPB684]UPU89495.1 cation diffusion facilitator family transporter [Demequina sp. TMPB413]
MSASHDQASASAGGKHRRALAWVLGLVLAFVGVEVVAGLLTGSLTLLADAGHMATDALGVGMALAAVTAARRAARNPRHTFGHYRWEVLAALANAALLLGVAVYVAVEGVGRLREPVDVDAWPVLVVAIGGLAVNLVSFRLLHAGSKESLNVRGAYLEVMADAIGSVGVMVSAIVILTTGWPYTDAVVALALAAFIVPRAVSLGREALRIVVQSAPASVDVDALTGELATLASVTDVHDVHVWTLTSGMDVASVHLVSEEAHTAEVVRAAQSVLREHGLAHATVQVEDGAGQRCGSEW